MQHRVLGFVVALAPLVTPGPYPAQASPGDRVFNPKSVRFTEVVNGTTKQVDYRGRSAITLIPSADASGKDTDVMAIIDGSTFTDGTIDIEVSGAPRANAPPDARGFVGIAFRVRAHADSAEVFYLRPTNGRADDQLRRNHTVQYISRPDYPWERLRQEAPGVYESYADLEPAVWTRMRVVISGTKARLFVNGASQPCLVVNDLKRGAGGGAVALWAHVSTEAYFGTVKVTPTR